MIPKEAFEHEIIVDCLQSLTIYLRAIAER